MDLSEAGIVEHSYKTEISPHALKMLNAYVTYVEIELCNPQAADAILLDAQRTREKLSAVAGSLSF